jgi:hypothetical protein
MKAQHNILLLLREGYRLCNRAKWEEGLENNQLMVVSNNRYIANYTKSPTNSLSEAQLQQIRTYIVDQSKQWID